MYRKIYLSREDRKAIDQALQYSWTLAIFTCFTNDNDAGPSIFDSLESSDDATSKSGDVHCLAAVTYYSELNKQDSAVAHNH